MKWENRGHEFDKYIGGAEFAQWDWSKFYIFGAGLVGTWLMPTLRAYDCLAAFIDNSPDKQGLQIDGYDVISFDAYLEKRDGPIVITALDAHEMIIAEQLETAALVHGKDYFLSSEFSNRIFPIISTLFYNKSYVSLVQITLTERCTLKCRKCAHGCYAVDNRTAKDLTLQQVYKSADSFFSKVDFAKEFVLIGGEPLLYKDLAQAIIYIGEKYREQMGIFSITTNGTIVPSEEVLHACRQYNVLFRISNYAKQLPWLRERHKRLTETLERFQISYVLGKEERLWMDYGFEYLDRGQKEEELTAIFDACGTPCREVRENRFYYCVMARSVSENLGFNVGKDDYLDLDQLSGENYKRELLEFTLGYSTKGYLDMCAHCFGAEVHNHPIPAAEQNERQL